LSTYWRSVILLGRNTASYKFALAQALLEKGTDKASISTDELAVVFAKNIANHLKTNPKQSTGKNNSFLDVCKSFNSSKIDLDELINATLNDGFRYVFDAFHNIPGGELPVTFYSRDPGKNGSVTLHNEFFELIENTRPSDFLKESEARWSLVETAWRLNFSENLISLNYDNETQMIMEPDKLRRRNITSARDALNGYQKGHCFYCFSQISITPGDNRLADVDHFLPHLLGKVLPKINLDGVWNLVLACQHCNRGVAGKFEQIPTLTLLERLHARNNFFIDSHHPLRETLMAQTGKKEKDRISFLQSVYNLAIAKMINTWEPALVGAPRF